MPTSEETVRSFTRKYDRIAKVISTEVFIYPAFNADNTEDLPKGNKFWGIWDTAATRTVITNRIIKDLDLPSIGAVKVRTSGGPIESPVYEIALVLANRVGVSKLEVTEAHMPPGIDVLIGMDIITLGDFAISNGGGKTIFSFRSPPGDNIDFVNLKS